MTAAELEELGCRVTCAQVVEFLRAYLDGELLLEVRRIFEAHLAICRECRNYLDSYRATLRATRELGNDAAVDAMAYEIPLELRSAILAARRESDS